MKSTTVRSALDLRKFGSAHSGSYLMNRTDPQQAALLVASQLSKTLYIDQSGGPGGTYGVLVGARNSINKDYTVSHGSYAHGSLAVFLNGQFLTPGATEDWIEIDPTLGTFQMVVAPDSDDVLTAMYGEALSGGGGGITEWMALVAPDITVAVPNNTPIPYGTKFSGGIGNCISWAIGSPTVIHILKSGIYMIEANENWRYTLATDGAMSFQVFLNCTGGLTWTHTCNHKFRQVGGGLSTTYWGAGRVAYIGYVTGGTDITVSMYNSSSTASVIVSSFLYAVRLG